MTERIDYKSVFDSYPAPRLLMRVEEGERFSLLHANESAVVWLGAGAAAGKAFADMMSGDIADIFLEASERAAREGKPVSVRLSASSSTASSFMVVPVGNGQLDIMAAIPGGEASSLRRERDDAISLLTSVFDVSEVGIVVTDRHQRIVRVNDSFVRIYGWNRDKLIGHEFTRLVAPDERDLAKRNHDEFIKSGIRSSGEMKLLRKDGSIANALYTTAALELSHGRRFQVTTVMDISMRKQMEISLRVAKEQADLANQAKSTFLANMSHELRTPLNAILGFSEMMMKETFGKLGNEKYIEYLGDIHLSARHLLEIINEVLDMSKIEAGRVDLDEEYFSVPHLLTAVIRMMDSRAFSGGIKIIEQVQDDLPALRADPRLVRQILINLVSNAVKYSRSGGEIRVISHVADNGNLQMIIADQGTGIPKERIREALEPFGQVSRPTGGMQGTGLGLPLAKAMTELHGGTLSLESEPGQGTIVTVEFPASRLKRRRVKGESPLADFKNRKPRKAARV